MEGGRWVGVGGAECEERVNRQAVNQTFHD